MELVLFLFVLLVLWPFLKTGFLFFFAPDEWKRCRERAHQERLENKRVAGGLLGLIGRFFR